jgi:ribonuclease D
MENNIFLIKTTDDLNNFLSKCENKTVIAIDLEGIDLSRIGKISLVTVSFNNENFIFDILNEELNKEQLPIIKNIFEDTNILKIIHDCRTDSDVLYHLLNIKLTNVFDTSVGEMLIKNTTVRTNLNNLLSNYSCSKNQLRTNDVRDFYKKNPNYWSVRPLTENMLNHAAGDVVGLYDIYDKMSKYNLDFLNKSNEAVDEFRKFKYFEVVKVFEGDMGRIIGRGGSNLKRIENIAKVSITTKKNGFLVLFNDKINFTKAKQMLN